MGGGGKREIGEFILSNFTYRKEKKGLDLI